MSLSETGVVSLDASLAGAPDEHLFHLLRSVSGTSVAEAVDRVLVGRYTWIVEHTARQYRNRGEHLDELRQTGFVGLMKAIRGFDSELGTEFRAYAWPTVRGEIRKHFRDRRRWIQIPRRFQELKQRVAVATDEFAQREGRSPSLEELAVVLDEPEQDVRAALAAQDNFAPYSLDTPLDAGDRGSENWGALLGRDDRDLDLLVEFEAVRPLLAEMPSRERQIVLLRYYGNRTQQEIAEMVGLSQMQVSRILTRLLISMRVALCAV